MTKFAGWAGITCAPPPVGQEMPIAAQEKRVGVAQFSVRRNPDNVSATIFRCDLLLGHCHLAQPARRPKFAGQAPKDA
jgi:hypothetical protein